jgi:hypothetical protein
MNVLELIKKVTYRLNINTPASVFGSTDPATLQLLALYEKVGQDLVDRNCWSQLKRTHSFNTASSTEGYALPSDFISFVPDTEWDTTNKWKVRGGVSDAEYNIRKNSYATLDNRKAYRIFGRPTDLQFKISPTPSATETITFDYLSNAWVRPTGSNPTYLTAVADDTNSSVFDDQLMMLGTEVEWYKMKGLEYSALERKYENKISIAQAKWNGSRTIDATGTYNLGMHNIPEGNWGY